MKAIKTFDQFVNETTINEGNGQTVKEFGDLLALLLDRENGLLIEKAINALSPPKARTLEKQISSLYKKLFNLSNEGFGMDESVVNEEDYDAAFNTNVLKNIKFILGSWNHFDKEQKTSPKPFYFDFKDSLKKSDVEKKIATAQRKHKSAKDIEMSWVEGDEFHANKLELNNLNYSGLTFIFAALDDLYGKFGAGMGWG